ncbi:hypothetical protein ACIOEW_36600 [Streptomyces sp. NPDC087901]|uniref:hypothetical protein n=1 Tax=Streptomyces sp. NPDC087901 TaxID=3365818 RepID=UPI003800404B
MAGPEHQVFVGACLGLRRWVRGPSWSPWASLCADAGVQAAVADGHVTDQLADDVADVAEAVTDVWARTLGPALLLAALRLVGHT